jgi:hypothetical protein
MFSGLNKSFASILIVCALLLTSCGKTSKECGTEEGRKAIVEAVDDALNTQNCAQAIAAIEPHYASPGCGTDEIRMARASAYACAANINFFQLVDDLQNLNISNAGLWEALTSLFPSSVADQRVAAGQFSLDALFALRIPGTVSPPETLINSGSTHPGALLANQRTQSSNIYSMFVSMSLVGALQNRYGAPNASNQKTQALGRIAGNADGWMDAAFVDEAACTYASSVLTMFDTISQVGVDLGAAVGGNLGTALTTLSTTFVSGFDLACEAGCQGSGGTLSGCNLPAGSCTPCPISLRNRNSCTGQVNDPASCAAAGLIYFINTSPLGWQGSL